MTKLTEEQFNSVVNQVKPLGLVKIEDVSTDDLVIEKYDEIIDYDDQGNIIDFESQGHTIKNFYLVNSNIFKSIFDEIKNNPNCSFVTPYNQIVKEGIIPEKVSVLIKDTRDYMEERVASQILNFYGVYCPANICAVGDDIFEPELVESKSRAQMFREALKDKFGFYTYLISIDFMSECESLETICKYEEKLQFFTSLQDSIDSVRDAINKVLNRDNFKNLNEQQRNKLSNTLEEQFVMSMLVRRVIFHDIDFNTNNVGILVGDNPRIMNFDFELCFGSLSDRNLSLHLINEVRKYYPKVWEKFLSKSLELYNNISNTDAKTTRRMLKKPQIINVVKGNLSFVDECNRFNYNPKKILVAKPSM